MNNFKNEYISRFLAEYDLSYNHFLSIVYECLLPCVNLEDRNTISLTGLSFSVLERWKDSGLLERYSRREFINHDGSSVELCYIGLTSRFRCDLSRAVQCHFIFANDNADLS